MFRRRQGRGEADEIDQTDEPDATEAVDDDADSGGESGDANDGTGTAGDDIEYVVEPPPRPQGPWDSHDVPDSNDAERLDLGSLQIPIPDGVEVRVEVQDDVVVAATFVDKNSVLQVHAFAAPKSSGVWREVRAEIAESLNTSNGSAQEADGPFGVELKARIPEEHGLVSARFFGVDGPRWFLRGLLTGPAATDPTQAKSLENAFRDVVVHRGSDAIAPRDLLPLHLPREALQAAGAAPVEVEPERPTLTLPERGPEITEIQ